MANHLCLRRACDQVCAIHVRLSLHLQLRSRWSRRHKPTHGICICCMSRVLAATPRALEAVSRSYASSCKRHLDRLSCAGPGKRHLSGPPNDEPRFLDMVKLNFEMAAAHTDLTPGMVRQIMACNSVLRIAFPIERVRSRRNIGMATLLRKQIHAFACRTSCSVCASHLFLQC